MKGEEITIAGLIKRIESGERKNIRLRNWELARLFGVYEAAIRANVKAIIQGKVIIPDSDLEFVQMGKTCLPVVHGLEMIIALAFRLHSPDADKLRKWTMDKIVHQADNKIIVFGINNLQILN
ncbi:hypothetical protein EZS27_012833 [termite gut metagenome]|jgi:hypothetical protein|uniref:Uncharacterized protein n=1 Tax=termite gut metagenome TaxID=433724 RepID=A0A5J4S079_9ZZZZ